MNLDPSDFHPKFVEAMGALEFFSEEDRDSPAVADLIAQVMAYAPEPLQAAFRAKARALGLLPDPAYCTEDGEPMYSTTQLANHLGIPLEEANRYAQELKEQHPDLVSAPGSKTVYRRQ